MIVDPYESGVLDEAEHYQLVANLDQILSRAGIAGHREAVWTPLSSTCKDREKDWVQNLWGHAADGKFGLVYDLDTVSNAHDRLVALVACLVRNFVNVRLLALTQAFDEQRDGEYHDEDVLVIPNFFIPSDAKDTPSWRKQMIHELLQSRLMAGQQTVLGIAEQRRLAEYYGKQVANLIKEKYRRIAL